MWKLIENEVEEKLYAKERKQGRKTFYRKTLTQERGKIINKNIKERRKEMEGREYLNKSVQRRNYKRGGGEEGINEKKEKTREKSE